MRRAPKEDLMLGVCRWRARFTVRGPGPKVVLLGPKRRFAPIYPPPPHAHTHSKDALQRRNLRFWWQISIFLEKCECCGEMWMLRDPKSVAECTQLAVFTYICPPHTLTHLGPEPRRYENSNFSRVIMPVRKHWPKWVKKIDQELQKGHIFSIISATFTKWGKKVDQELQ